jgi:GNAT superfamily N-acetyltransferase
MGPSVTVRFARANDLDWCLNVDHHVPAEEVQRKIAVHEIILAESALEALGYLRLEYFWSVIPYIALILVVEEHRGQGIGRSLLGFLEQHARTRGSQMVLSSSQVNEPEPQAWHRAMGFQECGILTGINEGGVGEVFFRKLLD